MPTFERGDLVAVPFPYVDRPVRERRPALVVTVDLGPDQSLCWVLMVTSAANAPWPGDVPIGDPESVTGLRAPSVIRTAKVATIDVASARRISAVSPDCLATVDAQRRSSLGNRA